MAFGYQAFSLCWMINKRFIRYSGHGKPSSGLGPSCPKGEESYIASFNGSSLGAHVHSHPLASSALGPYSLNEHGGKALQPWISAQDFISLLYIFATEHIPELLLDLRFHER